MNKTAIVILSDPEDGGEEALGRVFNGFATAYDIKKSGGEVSITFQGTGTRWIGHLTKQDHPLHALYGLIKENIAGVSCGCADFFGGAQEAISNGYELLTDNAIPGTSGLPSVGALLRSGTTVLIF
ncbi:MAG TPA: hypothetical protein ENJ32_07845 [Crenotrichaceae bacterium]|nr:hypothetical protein [Crenotrichaceae bacterium]